MGVVFFFIILIYALYAAVLHDAQQIITAPYIFRT